VFLLLLAAAGVSVWGIVGVVVLMAISGTIGAAIAEGNHRDTTAGFWLGALLGPLGWLLALLVPNDPEVAARANARAIAQVAAAQQAFPKQPVTGPSSNPQLRACPWCAEGIKAAAIICRFCQREVEPIHGTRTFYDYEAEDGEAT
jgi:hypothetical protein